MREHCTGGLRRVSTGIVAGLALAALACGGGGGGGGGGDATPAQTSSVKLAWDSAHGPVAGYDVWVSREGEAWKKEKSVAAQSTTLRGEPGETARIAVGAFDARGSRGPVSLPSPEFSFPDAEEQARQQAVAAAKAKAAASGSSSSSSASGSGSSGGGSAPPPSTPSTPPAAPDPEPTPEPEPDPGPSVDLAQLAGAILWQNGRALRVTTPWLETLLLFGAPDDAAQLAATGDLDGDGLDDPVWVDVAGGVSTTSLAALAADPAAAPRPIGSLAAGARLLGSADFDGDGRDDLLVQLPDARVEAWLVSASHGATAVALGSAGDTALAALGDFDGNGAADLAWIGGDGALTLWLSDGATVQISLAPGIAVLAAGDFDGDGVDEIALRNGRGEIQLLYPLATPLAIVAAGTVDTLRAPLGAGDLDRDGADDLALADGASLRLVWMPGDEVVALEPGSAWQPRAALR